MLIFLAFSFTFLHFFSTFVFMRNKLYPDIPKTVKTSAGRWLYIFPDEGKGYRLYEPLDEREIGHILFDAADNWIYDGDVLPVVEQEEVAGAITGHEKEMNELYGTIMFFSRSGDE
jgi:hypothetical protein